MGTNGLNALLNAAGLKEWTDNPPENNDEKGVDFYHLKALTQTLVDLYGEKGSQSLMRPANNHVFHELWTSDSRFEFSDEPEFKALDAIKRIEQGMHAFSNVLSDQQIKVIWRSVLSSLKPVFPSPSNNAHIVGGLKARPPNVLPLLDCLKVHRESSLQIHLSVSKKPNAHVRIAITVSSLSRFRTEPVLFSVHTRWFSSI
jgi:hypothetical protein